jgi:hypothetical protein
MAVPEISTREKLLADILKEKGTPSKIVMAQSTRALPIVRLRTTPPNAPQS